MFPLISYRLKGGQDILFRRKLKMTKNKKQLIITSIVCVLPMIVGAILYSRLPEQLPTQLTQPAIHWMRLITQRQAGH